MLGLEIYDNAIVAVSVGESGGVLARAESPLVPDAPSAALAVMERVAPKSAPSPTLGIAAANPDSRDCQAVVKVLTGRYALDPGGVSMWGSAAVVAEAWVGAARGIRDVVLFSVAEHTGAGIVRDGRPVMGVHRRAPAVAWMALNPVEREDYRKAGCLEAEVAAAGIVRRLIWRIKAGDRSRVQDLVNGDLSAITAGQVLEAARQQDGVSISVVRDTAKYLGMAAANLVATSDPEMLVLGGIMATAADLLFEPVKVEISRRLPVLLMQTLKIAPATLGADAGAIGAARLAAGTPQ